MLSEYLEYQSAELELNFKECETLDVFDAFKTIDSLGHWIISAEPKEGSWGIGYH